MFPFHVEILSRVSFMRKYSGKCMFKYVIFKMFSPSSKLFQTLRFQNDLDIKVGFGYFSRLDNHCTNDQF